MALIDVASKESFLIKILQIISTIKPFEMEVVDLMSIDYSGFAFPKNARIKNKKLIDDKKHDCEYCGRKNCWTNTHHIKSKGSGGNDTEDNLIELCGNCHRLVHDGFISQKELLEIKNRRKNI